MALEMPLVMQAVTGDPAIPFTAQQQRGMIDALSPQSGIVRKNDLLVGPRAAGANMTVDVAAGQCAIKGTSVAQQGTYLCRSTAVENVAVSAAPASGSRTDLIVARVFDKQVDGGTEYAWRPLSVTGTVGGGLPATPPSSIVLFEVAVAAGQTSVTAGNLTDRRELSGLGDVPLLDFSGTGATPQSIPSGAETLYQPAALFEQVGVGTTANPVDVVCRTPGRYAVHWCFRIAAGGSASERSAVIALHRADGTLLRRISAKVETANSAVLACAGTIRMRRGEIMSARIFQNSGGALSLNDGLKEIDFTGAWIGP